MKSPLIWNNFRSTSATITLTACITMNITTVLPDFPEYADMYRKAVTYLENNWHSRTDVFGLAIIASSLLPSPRVIDRGTSAHFCVSDQYLISKVLRIKLVNHEYFVT